MKKNKLTRTKLSFRFFSTKSNKIQVYSSRTQRKHIIRQAIELGVTELSFVSECSKLSDSHLSDLSSVFFSIKLAFNCAFVV